MPNAYLLSLLTVLFNVILWCFQQTVVHLFRNLAAINQFLDGAAELMQLVRRHPLALRGLLVAEPSELTAATIISLYSVQYSELGSNRRTGEDETIFSFDYCLSRCEGLSLIITQYTLCCIRASFWILTGRSS